jgi:hypothetical protein
MQRALFPPCLVVRVLAQRAMAQRAMAQNARSMSSRTTRTQMNPYDAKDDDEFGDLMSARLAGVSMSLPTDDKSAKVDDSPPARRIPFPRSPLTSPPPVTSSVTPAAISRPDSVTKGAAKGAAKMTKDECEWYADQSDMQARYVKGG